MKIKSLLLGSAAAMVAVSGAQAADAIIVEPEPVEYVRVCDAYGAGFFYIPGTETCIRFGGYVRSSYSKLYFNDSVTSEEHRSLTFWGQRARLDIDTRNETDWGTLRAQMRLEAGDANTDVDYDMDRALISIAGFRFGFTDNYWSTNHGYAGVGAEDIGALAGGASAEGGWYGFNDATMADYTFAANGFAVTIGVEDPRIRLGGAGANVTNTGGTDGRANFYAGFNWSDSWGGIAFTAVHDSIATEFNSAGVAQGGTFADGSWAFKASMTLNLSSWVPGGVINGYYMWDDGGLTDYVHNWGLLLNPDQIWGVTAQMNLTDELQLFGTYWHADGGNTNVVVAGNSEEGNAHMIGAGLNWFPAAAPGFSVRTGFVYGRINDTHNTTSFVRLPTAGADIDYTAWTVTVRRNF